MTTTILDRPSPPRPGRNGLVLAPILAVILVGAAISGTGTLDRVNAVPDRRPAEVHTAAEQLWGPIFGAAALLSPATSPATAAAPASPPATAAATPVPAAPSPPAPTKYLPSGKGMWIYLPDKTEGGNVEAIVAKAKDSGLSHLWVRMGSAWDGFNVVPFVDKLIPAAHAAGIKIIGWDFPKLEPVDADVARALAMIRHTTPTGHRIDAFSADIETRSEGTRISAEAARAYGSALRAGVGPDYTLIATVPRPSKERANFPFAEVVEGYDAIAPMVYWLNRQPDTDVAGALRDLARFGKPVYPVGQAYDGFPEGGRRGVPPPDELRRFMSSAAEHGAAGVSFWSWQAANQPAWDTIRDANNFPVTAPAPAIKPVGDFQPSP